MKNFQVSVAARLNTDRRETSETTFNPGIARRAFGARHQGDATSQNASNQAPASVDRNIPQERSRARDGRQSSEDNQKREELTNYEVSSKRVSVVSGGYAIETMSIAVLVNKASLGANLKPEEMDQRLSDIEQLVASASGLRKERGDVIKVSAVDFLDADRELEPVPPASVLEFIEKQAGTLIKSLTAILIAVLVVWFGLASRDPRADAIERERAVDDGRYAASAIGRQRFPGSRFDAGDERFPDAGRHDDRGRAGGMARAVDARRHGPQQCAFAAASSRTSCAVE